MALCGAGLCSAFLFRKDERLNFEDSLSRDAERPGPFLGGGGGNCGFDVMLVALEGTTRDPGRLWKPDIGRADEGLLIVGGGGGGGCGNVLADI
jgi:hypothetical protein